MGLPQTIAKDMFGGGLGGMGITKEDIIRGELKKTYGVENTNEPVGSPRDVLNPETNQVQMGVAVKGGGWKWLTDNKGQPLVVPPDADWRKEVIGGKVVEIAYSKKGGIILQNGQPLIRMNIPQETQFSPEVDVGGNRPGRFTVPPGGMEPGTAFRSAVPFQFFDTEGLKGEKGKLPYDPYNPFGSKGQLNVGGGSAAGGAPGVQVSPPKGLPGDVSTKINQVKTGLTSLEQYKNLLFNPDGTINRKNLFTSSMPGPGGGGAPFSKGKQLNNYLFGAIDPIQRAASGMMIRPEEEERYKARYGSNYWMNDQQVLDNYEVMINYLKNQASMLDPNEVWTSDVQKRFDKLSEIPGKGKGTVQQGKGKNLVHFEVGVNEYYIPPDKIDAFMKEFPKAKRLSK
jgi:hypothetical protein